MTREPPCFIKPDDQHLAYTGRWDTHDPAGPRCEWSASSVALRFQGTAAGVSLKDTGHNYYQIIVDGKPTHVLHPNRGQATYALTAELPRDDHRVEIFRRTEAVLGPTQVLGFQLSAGAQLLDPVKRSRRIEVIGDSISCGFGNEARSQYQPFDPSTENAWMAYGAITARHFDADYTCIAWSGRKMWPDNTVPDIYDLALPNDKASRFDCGKLAKPDAIVINLGTNDFAFSRPVESGWTRAYKEFVKRLRGLYPDAFVYIASGSMMDDSPELATLKRYLAAIMGDLHAAGDKKLAQVDFIPQNPRDGIGAQGHPSVKTHQIMAAMLQGAIERDLGW